MFQSYSGQPDARGLRIALVVSRYHEDITARLLDGARETIASHGGQADDIVEISVPGAWELPLAARAVAEFGRIDAMVCLGCVIRGDTTHHIHIGGEAARGIADVQLQFGIPIGFGLLTVDSHDQAIERAGGRHGNKGAEAALSAIELVNLLKNIPGNRSTRPRSRRERRSSDAAGPRPSRSRRKRRP